MRLVMEIKNVLRNVRFVPLRQADYLSVLILIVSC